MNNASDPGNVTQRPERVVGGDESIVMGSIPLSLFLAMSIVAALGFSYSIALLIFNIVHRQKKIIKMTSPNVNVVILLGCCVAFVAIPLLGFSSPTIPPHVIPKTLQACVFVLPLSFTMIYGSLFAKVVRIHMIFTNLSFNGKSTRDEHLLLGVLVLMLLDLAILLPWQLIDPITCQTSVWKTTDGFLNVSYTTEVCSSELQVVWISVIYAYKVVMLSFGLYFTWQTRFVTLPSIRDARLIFGSVQSVALLGLTALPVLLVTNDSAVIKYSVASLAIWFSLMTTITFLFIPKVRLLWMDMRAKETGGKDSSAAARMQFSESMTKMKNASKWSKCFFCCCNRSTDNNEDRYAQEILATEIETLKRTIKDKDVTIRELTDRLYIGTERFQEYLTTKTRRNDATALAFPPQPITQQQPHYYDGVSHTPHSHHPPHEQCPTCTGHLDTRRSTVYPAMVSDPRLHRLHSIPPGQMDRGEELRNYRLSRYYSREDEEEDEDYDSRSYSDGSCSTCAAADLLEMQQMRDAELRTQRMPAADGPRELSAATLSLSHEAQRGEVYTRSTPSMVASRYHHPQPNPPPPPFRSFPHPVYDGAPSSAHDSAYDHSPSSTESVGVELLTNASGRRRPIRSEVRIQRTVVDARNYVDGHTDPQIVGVFSVHRETTEEDKLIAREGVNLDANYTPSLATNHQTLLTSNTHNSRSHAPTCHARTASPTDQSLQGTTVSANLPIIPSHDLNPLVQLPVIEPVTSNSQSEPSPQLVASNPLKGSGGNVPQQLKVDRPNAISTSNYRLNEIRTFGLMSVTQI